MTPRARKPVDTDTYSGRFAERLKLLRTKAKLSVQETADRLGVSDQAIYCWETGSRQPKISDLPKLAQLFAVKRVKDILPNE